VGANGTFGMVEKANEAFSRKERSKPRCSVAIFNKINRIFRRKKWRKRITGGVEGVRRRNERRRRKRKVRKRRKGGDEEEEEEEEEEEKEEGRGRGICR